MGIHGARNQATIVVVQSPEIGTYHGTGIPERAKFLSALWRLDGSARARRHLPRRATDGGV